MPVPERIRRLSYVGVCLVVLMKNPARIIERETVGAVKRVVPASGKPFWKGANPLPLPRMIV